MSYLIEINIPLAKEKKLQLQETLNQVGLVN